MNAILLAAQAAAQPGGGFGNMIFFQNSLQEGSKVVTGGGIYGTVKSLDQVKGTVDVEIARGVVITVDKGYVFQDAAQQQPNA